MTKLDLLSLPETRCACATCRDMCQYNPCWPLPAEATRLLDAGHAKRMAIEEVDHVSVVCPARTRERAFSIPLWLPEPTPCAMLRPDGLCGIHQMKPIEGRLADCRGTHDGQEIRDAVLETWRTQEGRAVVARFRALTGIPARA